MEQELAWADPVLVARALVAQELELTVAGPEPVLVVDLVAMELVALDSADPGLEAQELELTASVRKVASAALVWQAMDREEMDSEEVALVVPVASVLVWAVELVDPQPSRFSQFLPMKLAQASDQATASVDLAPADPVLEVPTLEVLAPEHTAVATAMASGTDLGTASAALERLDPDPTGIEMATETA